MIFTYYNSRKTQAVLIGDSKTYYLTVTNAGIDVYGVTFGYGDPEVVRSLNLTYFFDRMKELKKAMAKCFDHYGAALRHHRS